MKKTILNFKGEKELWNMFTSKAKAEDKKVWYVLKPLLELYVAGKPATLTKPIDNYKELLIEPQKVPESPKPSMNDLTEIEQEFLRIYKNYQNQPVMQEFYKKKGIEQFGKERVEYLINT